MYFTLLEKMGKYGPVDPQPLELTSANITKLIKATIDAGLFKIPTVVCNSEVPMIGISQQTFTLLNFYFSNLQNFDLIAEPNSFVEIDPSKPDKSNEPFCDQNKLSTTFLSLFKDIFASLN